MAALRFVARDSLALGNPVAIGERGKSAGCLGDGPKIALEERKKPADWEPFALAAPVALRSFGLRHEVLAVKPSRYLHAGDNLQGLRFSQVGSWAARVSL
jgi:hypothetical protein